MLNGKTALITGSTAGIGLAVADRLGAQGCNLVINGIETFEDVKGDIEGLQSRHGIEVMFDGCNVGDTKMVEKMVSEAIEKFGNVDIVVNNAVTRVFGPIEDTDPADWDHALAVNLTSAFNTIRCAMPGMKTQNWGRIINMSSIYGMIGAADRANYVVSKTALIGLTRAIALETIDHDITCNAVCPGSVNTTHARRVIETAISEGGKTKEEAEASFLAGKQPTQRFIEPESIADLVVFLCSPSGRDINGATLPVDMAWSAS